MSPPTALLLPVAAALISGDLPTAARLALLAPAFAPPPGGAVTLDAREVRDFARSPRRDPARLRGWVTVTPPRGVCLTVGRGAADDDVRVCKREALSFTLGDLDRAGQLRWRVTTGDGDFGTELAWSSPYRIGTVTPFAKSLADPPEYRYLGSCVAEASATGRRVRIGLLTGGTWILRLPDADELLPQPDPIANLSVTVSGGKMSVADAQKEKDIESGAKNGEGGEAGEKAAAVARKAEAPKPVARNQREDRKDWAIPARNAYGMGASGFQPNGSVAPGMKGECRYIYQGPPEDPATGRLECHDTDGYRLVYLPLTCLGELQKK